VDDVLRREHHTRPSGSSSAVPRTTEASDTASDAQHPPWPSPPTPTTDCPCGTESTSRRGSSRCRLGMGRTGLRSYRKRRVKRLPDRSRPRG
jgi:hypothetical protein